MFRNKYNTRNKSSSSIQVKLKTEDKQKIIAAFDDHYDDSSDEEEINEKLAEYDANEKWKDLRKELKSQNTKYPLLDDNLLSFAAHAAANEFYHSNKVADVYYDLKKKLLHPDNKVSPSTLLQDDITDAVERAVESTLQHMQQFFLLSTQKKLNTHQDGDIFDPIKKKYLDEAQGEINEAIPALIQLIKSKKLCKRERAFAQEATVYELEDFEKKLINHLIDLFLKELNLKTGSGRKKANEDLYEILNARLAEIYKQFNFSVLKNSAGKQTALEKLSHYDGAYSFLIRKLKLLLESSAANGRVDTMLNQKIALCREEVACALLSDIAAIKNGDRPGKQLSKQEQQFFTEYFSLNRESVADELSRYYAVFLRRELIDTADAFHRPVLNSLHTFASKNPYEFYANVRLSNRSQLRQIKNCKAKFFKNDTAARSWKLNNTAPHDILEMQNLTNETLGRRDLVMGLANYEKIYQDICAVKSRLAEFNYQIDDKSVARWIRSAFLGEEVHIDCAGMPDLERQSMEEMIYRVAYLIHGCEAARNLAMMVIVPMMLDLIIETDEWTLEEAFAGKGLDEESKLKAKLMPMVPEGAVAAARSLESDYHLFMPQQYQYPGNQDFDGSGYKMRKEDLVKYEARIVRDWIYLKFGRDVELKIDNAASWLTEVITNGISRWYGIYDNARVARR